jgi:hypothetical protein
MVTASNFAKLLGNPRSKADREAGRLSDTAFSYLLDLLGEYATGIPCDVGLSSAAIEWGQANEPLARVAYCVRTGRGLTEVGFVQHPAHPLVGGSADALIGSDGGLEIKCPFNTGNHVRAWLYPEWFKGKHAPQVQGLMWITGREWWDLASYDPRCVRSEPLVIVRCERDEEFIQNLETRCIAFAERLSAAIIARQLGLSNDR